MIRKILISAKDADQTATQIDYILTNLPYKVTIIQVLDPGLLDHGLIYCTRKTFLVKSHNLIGIFIHTFYSHFWTMLMKNDEFTLIL